MIDYEKVLFDIVKPMCNDKDNVMVKKMNSLDSNEILLFVYASSEDIGRLIGRKGTMASAIRSMLQVAAKISNQKVSVKFEAL